MIAYTATALAFWAGLAACTLAACWLIDHVTAYVNRCRARRHRTLSRTSR